MKLPENPYLKDALLAYPDLYQKIIHDWQLDGPDAFWLTYSANYLFRFGSFRFALDPITLPLRIGFPISESIAADFSPAEMILISHDHSDHVNWKLLSAIKSTVRQWIIPFWMREQFTQFLGMPPGAVAFVNPGDTITFHAHKITVFNGNHYEDRLFSRNGQSVQKGLPCLAYLFEIGTKRYFLPGDTRSFIDTSIIPHGEIDAVIFHVFLGRLVQMAEKPPMLDQYCEFISRYHTNRIILTHLYEIGRDRKDIWTLDHSRMIIDKLRTKNNSLQIEAALTGDCILL
jgi:hypothetical protein